MTEEGRSLRVLVAPDAFKGTMSAKGVSAAIVSGLEGAGIEAESCPVADGGEGTAEIAAAALGGERHVAVVRDPVGRPIEASFWLHDTAAYIDLAEASGLRLLANDERDPLRTSTIGTGELMLAARSAGATRLTVAAGGSATVDGGSGAISAIADGGGMRGAKLTVLCDVETPYELAAEVFGPQKGASERVVAALKQRLAALADSFPADPRGHPYTGAAGGFAGGFWATMGARLEPGAKFLLDLIKFDSLLAGNDAIIVGEGRLDAQSFSGKIGGEIVRRAAAVGVPVCAVVGQSTLTRHDARSRGIVEVIVAGDEPALVCAGGQVARLLQSRPNG
jgi:glycerate kinase